MYWTKRSTKSQYQLYCNKSLEHEFIIIYSTRIYLLPLTFIFIYYFLSWLPVLLQIYFLCRKFPWHLHFFPSFENSFRFRCLLVKSILSIIITFFISYEFIICIFHSLSWQPVSNMFSVKKFLDVRISSPLLRIRLDGIHSQRSINQLFFNIDYKFVCIP